jgi:hypothetical protein
MAGNAGKHKTKMHLISLFIIRGWMAMALVNAAEKAYREELTLRPLIDGKVSAHFSFPRCSTEPYHESQAP